MKNPQNSMRKCGEKNQKIIDIINEKTFQPGLRTGKEKLKMCVERRDLVEKGLG